MSASAARGWREVPFGTIVSHSAFGPRFSGSAYADDGNIATLRTTDLDDDGRVSYGTMPLAVLDEDRFANHLLNVGDLVITRSGTCGIAAVFEGFSLPVLPGAFLIRFRLNDSAESRFYRYYFNAPLGRQNILSVARGAVQQNLNITNIQMLRVPLPPLSEQRRIINLLSAYDDLIENNRRRMALLEDAARQLYREWFVRLHFPGHEHTRIANGVPDGWERVPLGERVILNYGKSLKAEDRTDGPYSVYGSSGIVGYHEKSLTQGPVIILGRKGNVGSVYWSAMDYWPIDTVYFLNAETSNLWLYYALQHMHFISTDVAVPGLNRALAYSRPLLVPPPRILREFLDTVETLHEQAEKLDEMNQKLRAARDLLLPHLMTGEISV
jgi:type I restriction enzyme S subunit